MKRKHLVLFLLLLACAALFGWFLPVLLTERGDRAIEGKPETVSVRQIDLSYRADLSITERLYLVRELRSAQIVELKRGVQLTDWEIRAVAERFLRDLTGRAVTLQDENCSVRSQILSFGDRGSFVVWELSAELGDAWHCEALLDDQTGLLLRCVLSGDPNAWESLFSGLGGDAEHRSRICSALERAVTAHCRRQLPPEYSVELDPEEIPLGAYGGILLRGNETEQIRVPFRLTLADGRLAISP